MKSLLEKYKKYMIDTGYSPETVRSVHYILLAIEGYMRWHYNKSLDKVTEEELMGYFTQRSKGLSKRTLLKEVRHVRTFYRYCWKREMTLYDVGERLEISGTGGELPRKIPAVNKVLSLLEQASGYGDIGLRDRAILELVYSAGLRRKEVIGLKISDIDMREKIIVIREGKGGKDRVVPLGTKACEYISKYLEVTRPKYVISAEEAHLFLTVEGRPLKGGSVNRIFRKYANKSEETKGIQPHKLRHACALHMLRGGAPLEKIQELLGHKQINTTRIYTQLAPKDLKKAHKKAHPREKNLKNLNKR